MSCTDEITKKRLSLGSAIRCALLGWMDTEMTSVSPFLEVRTFICDSLVVK